MRKHLLFLLTFAFATGLYAQVPGNDECDNAIDLGRLPYCFEDIFTNVNATTSDIGDNNAPSCFNGGTTQRDIWFTFEAAFENVTLRLEGADQGANGSIRNPQVEVYRGDCNGLSEIACATTTDAATEAVVTLTDLVVGQAYYIRINDFSQTASANSGDFSLCLDERESPFLMGADQGSSACFGTLLDSGGQAGSYDNNEDFSFLINPPQVNCLEIRMVDFRIETLNRLQEIGDVLQFFEGEGTSGRLIAEVSGVLVTPFTIEANGPVTVRFRSDAITNFDGFELRWQCKASCDGSSVDNPTLVDNLPFLGEFSTCEGRATLGETSCSVDDFLVGPDYVFEYTSPGDICAEIRIDSELEGTGIQVFDGLPTDPSSNCVAQSINGFVVSADFRMRGTYYIVVANRIGCNSFDIAIEETACIPEPSLEASLCNPLNGCDLNNGAPVEFNFIDGFKDIDLVEDVNAGCWSNDGPEPDYFWFSIQAQANGQFGFIASGTQEGVSDLDINVWGPFDADQVCDDREAVINFIRNNQPLRSSWSSASPMTGLVRTNPVTGEAVTDNYDCATEIPGSGGDGFVRTIDAQEGQVYIVLLNDWANEIEDATIEIDWSPSDAEVIQAIRPELNVMDTSICADDIVQLELAPGTDSVRWVGDTATLSCTTCPNPVASPTVTSNYRAIVTGTCFVDSVDVEVRIFDLQLSSFNTQRCLGDEFQVSAGIDYNGDAEYLWTAPSQVELSCINCPDPIITVNTPGDYQVFVALDAPGCEQEVSFTLNVLEQAIPDYNIADDKSICPGESTTIGGASIDGVNYVWYENEIDGSIISQAANPVVAPEETTTYFLEVSNGLCPLPTIDSVTITVIEVPEITVANDTTICQEEPLLLSALMAEEDVSYSWTGPSRIEDPADPNSLAFPVDTGVYTLLANRAGCTSQASFTANVIPISVDIPLADTTFFCQGDTLNARVDITPNGAEFFWTNSINADTLRDTSFTEVPTDSILYIGTVMNMGCVKMDSFLVVVDSLPENLAIEPADTTICSGVPVVLRAPAYEQFDFPDIEHFWFPPNDQQTPDSLFNLVVTPQDTIEYFRITTNNACTDTARAIINVVIPPEISIQPSDTTICPGDEVNLEVIVPDGKQLEEIMWMPEDGSLSCMDCLTPTATPISTTQYMVSGTIDGCPVSASANVNVPADPGFIFNGRTIICPGDSVLLNETSNPLVEYTWTASPDNGFGTVTDAQPLVGPTETTTYTLIAVRTDAPTCQPFEAQITVQVIRPEEPTLVADDMTICEGDLTFLEAQFTPFPGETFLWTDNMGRLTESRTRVSVAPQTNTIYTFTLDRPGACPDFSGNVEIMVDETDTLAAENVIISADPMVVCEGSPVTLTAEVPGFDEATDQAVWSLVDGDTIGQGLVVTDIPQEMLNFYAFNFVGQRGCDIVTFESDVTVSTSERPELGPDESRVICDGESITLNANVGNFQYNWTSTDPGFGGATGPVITATPTVENAVYTVEVTNEVCPPEIRNFEVTAIQDAQAIQVGASRTVIRVQDPDRTTTVTATVTPTPTNSVLDSIFWFANGFEISVEGLEFVARPDSSTTYTIQYQAGGRCGPILEGTVRVIVVNIAIPNAFAPDGNNKRFNVLDFGNAIEEVVTFQVFNRWGQRVYDNENPSLGPEGGWDGTFNGTPQPSDVYAYIVEVRLEDGSTETFKGDVTLIR